MTELDGLDGRIAVTDKGISIERSRLRATGRGGQTSIRLSWDQVKGARLDGGRAGDRALRVEVVGHEPPRTAEADPYAVVLRRGQVELAGSVQSEIAARAIGQDPEPSVTSDGLTPAAREPDGTPSTDAQLPIVVGRLPAPDEQTSRLFRVLIPLLTLELWFWGLALAGILAAIVALIVLLVVL